MTVRRGGLTTARYREVMLTPVGPGLDQRQADWLDQCLIGAGATVLHAVPAARPPARRARHRTHRLPRGASPSTRRPRSARSSPSLVALRLRELLTADLRLRGGEPAGAADLVVRRRRSCAASWTVSAACLDEAGRPTCSTSSTGSSAISATRRRAGERMTARLRGERYLSLLDQLVIAARGGRIGDVAAEPTRRRAHRSGGPTSWRG